MVDVGFYSNKFKIMFFLKKHTHNFWNVSSHTGTVES